MAYLINGKLKVGSLTIRLKQSRGNEVQKGELQNLVSCSNIGIATAQIPSASSVWIKVFLGEPGHLFRYTYLIHRTTPVCSNIAIEFRKDF
jgi:hypothetical protein